MNTAFFRKKIDRRSRTAMVNFLTRHFRYDTASSWNGLSSYANKIKLNQIGLTEQQCSRAFDLLEVDYWDQIRDPIDLFTEEQDFAYTIGVNGRSGGYLVLYESSKEFTKHKSYCPRCFQRNYQEANEGSQCGVCGNPRANYLVPPWHLVTYFKGIDQYEEFDPLEWSMAGLRDRVDLICAFDRACDQIRENFIALLDHASVVTTTEYRPVQVKQLVCSDMGASL